MSENWLTELFIHPLLVLFHVPVRLVSGVIAVTIVSFANHQVHIANIQTVSLGTCARGQVYGLDQTAIAVCTAVVPAAVALTGQPTATQSTVNVAPLGAMKSRNQRCHLALVAQTPAGTSKLVLDL